MRATDCRPYLFVTLISASLGCASPSHSGSSAEAGPPHGHGPGHADVEHDKQHSAHHDRHHSFSSAEYIKQFEDPARKDWQKPDEVAAKLALDKGAKIADIGAGSGYFTTRFAKHVGPDGRAYAVDIEPNMLAHVKKRAEAEALPNMLPVQATPSSPNLPEPVDVVFVCNTWHHIDDRVAYLKALEPHLNPGARIAIVDFVHDMDIPVHAAPKAIRLSEKTVVAEFKQAGFVLADSVQLLPYQYFLIFESKAQ